MNKLVMVGQRYMKLPTRATLTSLGYYYDMEQEKISRIITVTHQLILHVY